MATWPDKSGLDTRDEARGIAVKLVRVLLSLLTWLLSACAIPHWVKPEASKSDLAQDQAACVQAIQQPPPGRQTNSNMKRA
jgi:hypothetical protein